MRFRCRSKINKYDGGFYSHFALKPIGLDDGTCIWLEKTERSWKEIDPGNWAGGGCYAWTYRTPYPYEHLGIQTVYR